MERRVSIVGEVGKLQSQLSVVTNDRNDLMETVHTLNHENKELGEKLTETEEVHSLAPDDGMQEEVHGPECGNQDIIEQGTEGHTIENASSGESEGQTVGGPTRNDFTHKNKLADSAFNESAPEHLIEHVSDNHETTMDINDGAGLSPHKSQQCKSNHSRQKCRC